MFTLRWEGGEQPVFIKEVQVHPVRQAPLHVDFFAPNLLNELSVTVPLHFTGANPPADGALTTSHSELTLRALPTALPHQLEVDLSGLVEVGAVLRAGDIPLPDGVTLETGADEVVVLIAAATAPEPEPEPEAAEAAAEAPVLGEDLIDRAEGEVAEAVGETATDGEGS
jgi:large subunit ribosomal protein L25